MIRKLIALFALAFLLYAQGSFAHGGGHGPINPFKAVSIALETTERFTRFNPGLGFGTLDSSWKGLSRDTSKVVTEGKGYYIVSVENKDAGKTLYILMSTLGRIYDANFSGEFPRVE